MKKNQLAALWAIACCLLFSCHKPDFPGATKACQIVKVQSWFAGNKDSIIFIYGYNHNRSLDSLRAWPTFLPSDPVRMHFEYNAQSLPVFIKIGNTPTKLIWQNGRIVRIEELQSDNQYHIKFTYKYDAYGRVVRRGSASDTIRWEYKDASNNFSKRVRWLAGEQENGNIVYEFRYDHKINPLSTWPDLPLNPFAFDLWEYIRQDFEPIPDNNCIYQAYIGQISGVPFTYMEIFHTYTYDNMYPIKDNIRQVQNNPSGPGREQFIETKYTYDCKDNTNGHY